MPNPRQEEQSFVSLEETAEAREVSDILPAELDYKDQGRSLSELGLLTTTPATALPTAVVLPPSSSDESARDSLLPSDLSFKDQGRDWNEVVRTRVAAAASSNVVPSNLSYKDQGRDLASLQAMNNGTNALPSSLDYKDQGRDLASFLAVGSAPRPPHNPPLMPPTTYAPRGNGSVSDYPQANDSERSSRKLRWWGAVAVVLILVGLVVGILVGVVFQPGLSSSTSTEKSGGTIDATVTPSLSPTRRFDQPSPESANTTNVPVVPTELPTTARPSISPTSSPTTPLWSGTDGWNFTTVDETENPFDFTEREGVPRIYATRLSHDGRVLAVAAESFRLSLAADLPGTFKRIVRVYQRIDNNKDNNNQWRQMGQSWAHEFRVSLGEAYPISERSPLSLALSENGQVVAFSSPRVFGVQVWAWDGEDQQWKHQTGQSETDGIQTEPLDTTFGQCLDLANNGTRLAIGQPGFASDTGIVYLYEYTDEWRRVITTVAPSPGIRFGSSVSLPQGISFAVDSFATTESVVAVGAAGANQTVGSVYIYQRVSIVVVPVVQISWQEVAEIKGNAVGDAFGSFVKLNLILRDGTSPEDDDSIANLVVGGSDFVAAYNSSLSTDLTFSEWSLRGTQIVNDSEIVDMDATWPPSEEATDLPDPSIVLGTIPGPFDSGTVQFYSSITDDTTRSTSLLGGTSESQFGQPVAVSRSDDMILTAFSATQVDEDSSRVQVNEIIPPL